MAIDRGELRKLILDFEVLPKELRKEIRPAMRKAAHPILEQMHHNASYSTRIPPATKITTTLSQTATGVSLFTDGRAAPHAALFEDVDGDGGWWHPVFGNRRAWAHQNARPYFYPAVEQHVDDVRDALDDAVVEILARHGF